MKDLIALIEFCEAMDLSIESLSFQEKVSLLVDIQTKIKNQINK